MNLQNTQQIVILGFGVAKPSSCQVVFWPKLWNQKLSKERHWAYTHAVLRMEWPQPLIYEALCYEDMKHSLHLHPKEKKGDSYDGEGMRPSSSMICSSCQPHHFIVVCMELSVPFESPLFHRNSRCLL